MTTFTNYQRGGIYTWAHPRIVPALTEISRAVGVPDVAMSCLQPKGVGLHKTGEACDFQAGNAKKYGARYRDGFAVHEAIAKYALKNWERLRIRYMAWNRTEWGGHDADKTRVRRQTTYYGGSDPYHEFHVHIDFLPGKISGANASIAIGSGLTPKPPSSSQPTPTYPDLEDDMKLVKAPTDAKVYATNGITKRYIKTPAELRALNKIFGATVTLDKVALDAIPEDRTTTIKDIASDSLKTKAEVGRSAERERDLIETSRVLLDAASLIVSEVHDSDSKKTLRERMEQTNHAVGRAEKARLADEQKQEQKS